MSDIPRNRFKHLAHESPGSKLIEDESKVPAVWNIGDVILNQYEVKQIHAGGGMGLVYRVHHRGWNVDLAVKCPRVDFFRTQQQKDTFVQECETWINLGLHPHIVSCYYIRTLGGIPRIFAEYVEGGSLKELIESRGLYEGGTRISLKRILDIAFQMVWGLQYAHDKGLVHQDVKPGNVLVDTNGTAKITDFGLAKARAVLSEIRSDYSQKTVFVTSGGMTPAYCSPEQANGKPLSRGTDIWSWAVSVMEMFTGGISWMSGEAAGEVLEDFLEAESDAGTIPPIPHRLERLLRSCFRRDPKERPNSFRNISEILLDLYQEQYEEEYSRAEPNPVELSADSLNNRALSLSDLGRPDLAEIAWKEALSEHKRHLESTYNLGLMMWRSALIDDSRLLSWLSESITGIAEPWRGTILTAKIHLERGDCESVISDYGRSRNPDFNKREVVQVVRSARELFNLSRRCLLTFAGHQQTVSSVCLSMDSRWALSGSADTTLKLWDTSTGSCVRSFEGHANMVTSACLSNNNLLALSGSRDRAVKLWDIETGRCLHTFDGHTDEVESVYLSKDNQLALTGSSDRTLKFWDVATGRCLHTFDGHKDTVASVCMSEDNRLAMSGSWDGTLRLWDVTTGHCLCIFQGHTAWVRSVCLSKDSRWALSGSDDGMLKLWEVATGRSLITFEGHRDGVNSVCLSRDSKWALSGSEDKTFKLWEVTTGRCLRTFEGHTEDVRSVWLSEDSQLALSGSHDATMKLWRMSLKIPWPSAFPVLSYPISADAAELANRRYRTALEGYNAAKDQRDFVSAASYLRKARSVEGCARKKNVVELWLNLYRYLPKAHFISGWEQVTFDTESINAVCLSENCLWALSGNIYKTIELLDLQTGRCLRTFVGHAGSVESVCLSTDSRWALSGSSDESLKLWEVSTGRCLRTFVGHAGSVESVCLSTDSRWALSGSSDESLKLWEVSTGRCLRTLEAHVGGVTSVCLSIDDRWALSGGFDDTVKLWNVLTGGCLRTFEGHTEWVTSVCLSTDSRWALSGSDDTTLKLWDVTTGSCLRTFEGHTDQVTSVSLSIDNRFALSAGADAVVRLWDMETGRCLHTFEGHTSCLSSDGSFALLGHALWVLDWELEDRSPKDWDEGARPYLSVFLTTHTPYIMNMPADSEPSERQVRNALTRRGSASWTEKEFQQFLYMLDCAGYGWLSPERVRSELDKMAGKWEGPSISL